jgi:hypothetical protein
MVSDIVRIEHNERNGARMRLLESMVVPYRPLDLTPYASRREACYQLELVQTNCDTCALKCRELCGAHACDGHGLCLEVICLCMCNNI